MKKRYYVLVSVTILCLCIAFVCRIFTPTHEPFEHTMTGYLVTQDGAGQPCEVRVAGTRNTYPTFSTDCNSIRFVDSGGIFLNGTRLAIDHFVFPHKTDQYAICSFPGVGTFLLSLNGDCIIGILENDYDDTLFLAPASTKEEALILISHLESLIQGTSSSKFFQRVRSYF